MARLMLFLLTIITLVAAGFALGRRGTRSHRDPDQPPEGMVGERGMVIHVVPGPAAHDPRLGVFLRQAMLYADSWRAEYGDYPRDVTKLAVDRPANVTLHIVRVGTDGIRMTAIDHKRDWQCDLFAGDSARWAFGYAYDPRMPACGRLR